MKRRIFCVIMMCTILCQPVYAAESWPNSAIGNTSNTSTARNESGGKGVRIAVIDTGISVNAIAKERISKGKNYITGNTDTEDKIGHGTAMAGIIVGMESKDLTGIAPNATLVPLVYYTKDENENIVDGGVEMLAKAIRESVDKFDCQIILIGAGTNDNSKDLQSAIEHAEKKGAVVISSVGNENEDFPDYIYYPAAYETVIGVAALREDGGIATFSQRNSSVDLSAPGTDLKVATIRGKTIKAYGTSYSAAFVAAAAAQLLSDFSSLTPEQVRLSLCNSSKDMGSEGYDSESGYGVLQIDGALGYAKPMDEANRKEAAKMQKKIILFTCVSFAMVLVLGSTAFVIKRRHTLKKGFDTHE
ncbi:S8 family peptidase [[Clostridium] fimetarium]|uniref:Minor extracellular protease Epr n=1 Tax=[Clostridium] fimetarium TaxID=99656 RepID=A0A1I0R0C1_9FIRM|nr:S8 family serine peptidase [[Clostridium] fimetarium]SEW33654.1 minor extracellular protease Epr [[Clostridium] fimetarium]